MLFWDLVLDSIPIWLNVYIGKNKYLCFKERKIFEDLRVTEFHASLSTKAGKLFNFVGSRFYISNSYFYVHIKDA